MIYKYGKNMGNNPATVNIETGVVFINKPLWNKLTDYEKAIILLHEEGHYANKSLDEIKADCYAISQYLKDGDTPEKRQQLKKTIFGVVPNDEENIQRKIAFVRNLLQYDSTANGSENSKNCLLFLDNSCVPQGNTANVVGTVLGVISVVSTGLKIGTQIAAFIKGNKDRTKYWHELDSTTKDRYIKDAANAVIMEAFYRDGGDFGALQTLAQLPASDSRSLACKTFEVLAQTVPMAPREFNGATQVTAAQGASIFWSKQGLTGGIQKWMLGKVNSMRKQLESSWESLSFFDKVAYSTRYKIYVVGFLLLAFIVWRVA